MTTLQIVEIVAIAAGALALAAVIGLVIAIMRLRQYLRQQRVVLGSRGDVDVVSHVVALDEKQANLRSAIEDLNLAVRDHEVRIDNCISRTGMVRFDAFQDLGGQQSTSMAILNARDDGMVVSTLVTREFARMYVKNVKEGVPDIPLAPEEEEALAIARARGNQPFTVRPRVDLEDQEERGRSPASNGVRPAVPGGGVAIDPSAKPRQHATKGFHRDKADRELAAENRRRRRAGLPPLTELPPSIGWEHAQTPVPPGLEPAPTPTLPTDLRADAPSDE